ncbi:MAG: ABC transporter permease [Planctomycetes bacterium]|nr:ABC transporter permease [Planctomycetota bacterium]
MYKLLLSIRYFRSRFLAIAALLAITFGVAMLLIVLGVMGGYLVQLKENIRGQESHLQVVGPGQYGVPRAEDLEELILGVENVQAAAPFIERLAVYKSLLSFSPCQIKGIDAVRQMGVGALARQMLRPEELQAILDEFLPELGPDGAPMAEPDPTKATRAVHRLIHDPSRPPLSEEEVARFFTRSWRGDLLRRENPAVHERLQGDVPPAALVGIQLLLDEQMALGQIISITTLKPETQEPATLDFVVAGAIKTGDFDEDSATIWVDLGLVKNWLGLWEEQADGEFVYRYQGIRVALEDPERLEETRRAVETALRSGFSPLLSAPPLSVSAAASLTLHPLASPLAAPPSLGALASGAAPPRRGFPNLRVRTWEQLRINLIKAVRIEKFLVYFLVLILVFFTGSMILLMLLLAVIEKTRDIGILMSLGATPQGVTSIFLLNGSIICLLGTALGFALGLTFCSYINDIHDAIYDVTGWSLFRAEIYHMDRIPIAFQPLDILLSTVPPVCIGLLASLIPALWAPRRDPIRAIQYE